MFGLTFEKLLVVGVIAAIVIGPHRLPGVVARLASLLRGLRRAVDTARARAATELGVPADATEWRALDPRQYDPRRIIAEALAAPAVTASAPVAPAPVETDPIATTEPDAAHAATPPVTAPPRVSTRRIRVGTSAHPRWIDVPIEAPTDADAVDPAADAVAPAATLAGRPAGRPAVDDSTVRMPVTA